VRVPHPSLLSGKGWDTSNLNVLLRLPNQAGTLSYTYHPTGQVESINSSNSNGAWVTLTWDELNRLSTVVDNRLPGQNTITYTYDATSNIATVTAPNGLQSLLLLTTKGGPSQVVKSIPSSTPAQERRQRCW